MKKRNKKKEKINIKWRLIVACIFFLIGFYNTHNSILPNSFQASLYKTIGRIYDVEKPIGSYAIKVDKIEKTRIESPNNENGIFYILEYARDMDLPKRVADGQISITEVYDDYISDNTDYSGIGNLDIEKVVNKVPKYNKGIIMLEAKEGDKYIEEVYSNKDKLHEKNYYITIKSVPRYTEGYRSKVANITTRPDLVTKFSLARSENSEIFTKGLGNVSTRQYVSMIELEKFDWLSISGFIAIGSYAYSFYSLFLVLRENSRRKFEREGIWEEIKNEEK
ncbi:MAG: hypothetical protein Q3988_01755 [Gemella sp.]|nr:hypothetical protein [Gemella sp.]